MRYLIHLFALICLWGTKVNAQELSLHDKIGQMLIIGFDGKHIDEHSMIVKSMAKSNVGGVILFDFNSQKETFDKNIESPQQVKQLNHSLQEYNRKINLQYNRPALPLLISVDYEGGRVNRLKEAYGFPATYSAIEVTQMGYAKANQIARDMSQTLKDCGFNLDFAPVLDVNTNPENPIIGKLGRSFSENPAEVAAYGEIFSQNFLQAGIQCAYKHFPGHGSSQADSHLGFVDVTETWHPSELEPYQQLFAQGNACGMVMTAHIINRKLDGSGVPATLSYKILTDILRHELKFNGVIITDDMQMKAITDHYGLEQSLTMAINAGADMLIFGNQLSEKSQDPEEIISIIEHQIQVGKIEKQRIEESYRRIVAFKESVPA